MTPLTGKGRSGSFIVEKSGECVSGSTVFGSPSVVFSVHGIRTNGFWQDILVDVMRGSGIQARSFNYGNFGLSRLIYSKARRRVAEQFAGWFDLQIKELGLKDLSSPEKRPSVVAHSFGALVVALALLEYREISINKLILSGSIVPCDFEWDVLMGRGQVEVVRNEMSLQDLWPEFVSWVVSGAGASGRYGFAVNNHRLQNQRYSGYGHCDYVTRLHFEANWVPFLQGK